ncbi:MAG: HypC/HybG/HupF family hydrogenase formation chaperone [Deltaproteobacteria bacterium]|nr:HypC/HybG/HupF family hydrogenase formation chaperone [Deltaproteobacteria bacterium]
MCMGVPMEVVEVEGLLARCQALGTVRDVNLMLLGDEPVQPGDHVLVHLGMAVRTLTKEEVEDLWEVMGQLEAPDEAPG